ncbi:hypothetical protein SAMN02745716_1723 [Thermoleophilum album]|uniref:Uncharacterized protein n=1 Tax=Thermoleophilum album TaxID=29539 RepID=A0A1H6FX35_THEAL|nr:hypothetical protein SAMN02745716_1723 [Thermoleophilum album]
MTAVHVPVSSTPASGLRALSDTEVPRPVRQAGREAVTLYRAAVTFESLLVKELLGASGVLDSLSAAHPLLGDQAAEALVGGVANGGGLGLAEQLYRALAEAAGVATKHAGGAR